MQSSKNGTLAVLDGLATLLRQTIRAVSTDSLIMSLGMGQFDDVIDELCGKAPDVAQGIANVIQTRLNDIHQRSPAISIRLATRKRKPNLEPTCPRAKLSKAGDNRIARATQHGESRGPVGVRGRKMVVPSADASAVTSIPMQTISGTTTETDKEQISEDMEIRSNTKTSSFYSDLPGELVAKNDSFIETVLEATETLHRLTQHGEGPFNDFYRRVLDLFRGFPEKMPAASTGDNWSDGSIWVQVLGMGTAQQERRAIFTMMEYMGAWAWYDGQIKLAQNISFTKRGRTMKQRGVASHILDSLDKFKDEGKKRSRWISGVGQITLQDDPAHMSKIGASSIGETRDYLRRRHITMDLKRGQKLSTKLVKELGLGILFHPKIWALTEMSMEKLNAQIEDIKSDKCHTKLLRILGVQLECLVETGSPDLDSFYADLRKEELLAQDELEEMSMQHGNPSHRLVSNAIQDLTQRLGHDASTGTPSDRDNTFTVSGSVELSFDVFKQLLPGNWLDNWAIMAAMHISDKPANVRYDISIPLDENTKHRGTQQIERPLARWAETIANRREITEKTPGSMPLVHFCPINHSCNHFTLLEINDKTKTICHYDSMADRDTIDGRKKTRIHKLIDEQFGGQGFSYQEIPTPQQEDEWSCGVRVVWNFQRRANDLPIGSWDTILSPHSVTLDILNGLITCVEEDTFQVCR